MRHDENPDTPRKPVSSEETMPHHDEEEYAGGGDESGQAHRKPTPKSTKRTYQFPKRRYREDD
jgi:hypothetical protein